jgi:hypothetical protein
MKLELRDEDFDFGFSVIDESELKIVKDAIASSSEKVYVLYNAILPLLDNLAKNPDKDYIYWPDRISKIEDFKLKLKNIYES